MVSSVVLHQGPSMLSGEPIVALATGLDGSSMNSKTGAMVQTWILRSDVAPVTAVRAGSDSAVCGDCPLRGRGARACYVNVGQAPQNVWLAWQRGAYPQWDGTAPTLPVRLGAYGDPAAVPTAVWRAFLRGAPGWSGYTHQWRRPEFDPQLLKLCSASIESPKQIEQLPEGARYFRVRRPGEKRLRGEMDCPSSRGVTCAECQACNGMSGTGRSVSIDAHGSATTMRAWEF